MSLRQCVCTLGFFFDFCESWVEGDICVCTYKYSPARGLKKDAAPGDGIAATRMRR